MLEPRYSNSVILFGERGLVTLNALRTTSSLNTVVQTEPEKEANLSSDFKKYQMII